MNVRLRAAGALAAMAFVAGCTKKPQPRPPVRVITTAELAGNGSIAHLGAVFGAQSGAHAEVRGVDAAAIPAEVARGAADVVIVNDAGTVAALRKAGRVRLESVIANDGFLIAGPRRNPAHIHPNDTAERAFRRIYARRQPFCSVTAPVSVHQREQELWSAIRADPRKNKHYRACDGSAPAALKEADRAGAYILIDRATFDAAPPEHLVPLLRGVPLLANDVVVILIEQPRRRKDADWFVEWLMSYRGREAVESDRVDGHRLLYNEP